MRSHIAGIAENLVLTILILIMKPDFIIENFATENNVFILKENIKTFSLFNITIILKLKLDFRQVSQLISSGLILILLKIRPLVSFQTNAMALNQMFFKSTSRFGCVPLYHICFEINKKNKQASLFPLGLFYFDQMSQFFAVHRGFYG